MSATQTDIILRGRLSGFAEQPDFVGLAKSGCHIRNSWPRYRSANSSRNVFLFSYLCDLADELDQIPQKGFGSKRFVLFQDKTPIESFPQLLTKLDIRKEERLHLARLDNDSEQSFLYRFVSALNNDHQSIMDAWWDNDDLYVISPQMQRIRIAVDQIPKVRKASKTRQRHFEIDCYGSYLYWPDIDVHIGWEQLQQLVDPQVSLRIKQQSDHFNKAYGQAIRIFRSECNITQNSISNLDARTVRRIEKGETRATARAIACLAKAHQLNSNDYMNEIAERIKHKSG